MWREALEIGRREDGTMSHKPDGHSTVFDGKPNNDMNDRLGKSQTRGMVAMERRKPFDLSTQRLIRRAVAFLICLWSSMFFCYFHSIDQGKEKGLPARVENRERYKIDDLCPSCRFSLSGPSSNAPICLQRIQKAQANNHTSFLQAAHQVAAERPEYCGSCINCTDHLYWHLDAVAPPEQRAVTHYLHAVNRTHFSEFNPSLVRLETSGGYLAAYRVSNQHNCPGKPEVMPESTEYLGLALLDEQLNILRQGVYDIDTIFTSSFADPRLFVLHSKLYLTSFARMHELFLEQPSNVNHLESPYKLFTKPAVVPLPPLEGDWTIYFRGQAQCTAQRRVQRGGKNLNYFELENNVIMEVEPMRKKEVIRMDKQCTYKMPKIFLDNATYYDPSSAKLPSFATSDELEFTLNTPPYTGERGGACCIHMTVRNETLLVGISHSKTRFPHRNRDEGKTKGGVEANHFFSRLYAMKTTPPFDTVHVSGKFCLGHAQASDAGNNPRRGTHGESLRIMSQEYACPRIHFVSSMVLSHDSQNVIVAYGINDCMPRMVQWRLSDVERLLLGNMDT